MTLKDGSPRLLPLNRSKKDTTDLRVALKAMAPPAVLKAMDLLEALNPTPPLDRAIHLRVALKAMDHPLEVINPTPPPPDPTMDLLAAAILILTVHQVDPILMAPLVVRLVDPIPTAPQVDPIPTAPLVDLILTDPREATPAEMALIIIPAPAAVTDLILEATEPTLEGMEHIPVAMEPIPEVMDIPAGMDILEMATDLKTEMEVPPRPQPPARILHRARILRQARAERVAAHLPRGEAAHPLPGKALVARAAALHPRGVVPAAGVHLLLLRVVPAAEVPLRLLREAKAVVVVTVVVVTEAAQRALL